MTQSNPPEEHDFLNDSVMRRINYRVNRLGRKFGLPREDREDLRQTFCLAMLRAGKKFDPEKCEAERFVQMVLNRHYKYFVRRLARGVDDGACSIDAMELDTSDSDYEQILVDHKGEEDRRRLEISEDVQTVISNLPDDLRELCYELMDHTPSEIAHKRNIHHSAVYRSISELRKHFVKSGIEELF